MMINSDTMVSITEANQNFSRVARLVDQNGQAVILKNTQQKQSLMHGMCGLKVIKEKLL